VNSQLPDDFAERFGRLPNVWKHPVVRTRLDDTLLPGDAREFLSRHGLPSLMIFECQNSFEISFAPLEKKLACYNEEMSWGDFYDARLDRDWSKQIVMGEEEFCNGHASFCVHRESGEVSRIDCQLENPRFLVNSNVILFNSSLLVAEHWSDTLKTFRISPSKDALLILRREFESIDPKASKDTDYFWRKLVDYVLDCESMDLEITDDPSRSQPRF
jgi:hypothetical protein